MPSPSDQPIATVVVSVEAAGARLDRFLAASMPDTSRTRVQALIRSGLVSVAGQPVTEPKVKVAAHDIIAVVMPPPEPAAPLAEPMALAVIHEDEHLIVIDKPAGWVVHPAPGHGTGTLVNALLAHCGDSLSGIGGVRRPGIVHRLDKDTSGLLVVAKSDAAHRGLSEQFAAHGRDGRLHRAYLGVCWGRPLRPRGRIEANLLRSPANRTKMTVVGPERGRSAITHYEVVEAFERKGEAPVAALMRLVLETGRTHQIRVHLAHEGHPLIGDPTYGAGFRTRAARLPGIARAVVEELGRQALHAAELGFEHPVTGETLGFESPLPPDIAVLVAALRGGGPGAPA